MSSERPVVVGIDGSDQALRAVAWAAHEAADRGLPLRVLHGSPRPVFTSTPEAMAYEWDDETLDRACWELLDDATALARRVEPGLQAYGSLRHRRPVEAILRAARTASLVVVGSSGHGEVGGALFGSTAAPVAAHAPCPVVVVHEGEAVESAPIVVGLDPYPAEPGRTSFDEVLAFAFDHASRRHAPLVAVRAWNDVIGDPIPGLAAPAPLDWNAGEQTQQLLTSELLAGWREKYPDVEVRPAVVRARAVRALLDAASGAQLLVVGSRGRGGFASLLLGSVSRALIHKASCPVAVIRTGRHVES